MNRAKIVSLVSSLTIFTLLSQPAFALKSYSTLYQNLNGATVAIATALTKQVDSLSTLYSFRIEEVLSGKFPDSTFAIITFMGKNVWVEDEEKFEVGTKYLLLLYRGPLVFQWDSTRHRIYSQSGAFYTVRSFPATQSDFDLAVEATRILLKIRLINDPDERSEQFLRLLKSKNDYLLESAIEELKTSKESRSIPDLRRLTESRGSEVRYQALTALYELNGIRDSATYFKSLRDPGPLVRQRALQALIWSKAELPEDTLIDIATDKNEYFANRELAMNQLVTVHCTRAIPVLEHVLEVERDYFMIRLTVPRILDSLKTYLNR